MVEQLLLMEQVYGVLIMTLLKMLKYLVLIKCHHLMLLIVKIIVLVLGKGPTCR